MIGNMGSQKDDWLEKYAQIFKDWAKGIDWKQMAWFCSTCLMTLAAFSILPFSACCNSTKPESNPLSFLRS